MGNRHGGEKPKEEKKKRKEKKSKHKGKKKMAAGSDVDVDMESSHFSRADSESMVFHSAENLSPYLDASTRSEEGAAYAGFPDNGHILSSRDFHDGFSIEACLPADLAAVGRISNKDDAKLARGADDGTSVASGGYSTPLLSSPQVRRGVPRSPLAQRPKDSFLEPVPPIPSDFSSNTLSSAASVHEDLTSSGERCSSRASSSTIDTNAAHCIERLEELERNIERTIIEKFSDGTSPLLKRRAGREEGEESREGSVTPKRFSGGSCQSVGDSPATVRKVHDAGCPSNREGSLTPKGFVRGLPSQSLETSPVILRKAVAKQDSPSPARRTPTSHGSPSLSRTTPVKPESPVIFRRALNASDSPSTARRTPTGPESPRLQHQHVGSPRMGRRRAPESPLIRRKGVPLSEDSSSTDQEPPHSSMDGLRSRERPPGLRDNQTSQKSPSRSPEVRKKPGAKTPSPSPSPRSLGRKIILTEDKKPAVGSASPVTQIKFCELNKGTPIKHCIVSTQPSTAVVLSSMSLSQESVDGTSSSGQYVDVQKKANQPFDASAKQGAKNPSEKPDSSQTSAVSEEAIKESSESAVFGSVSPKLKRQKKIVGTDQSVSPNESLERQIAESLDSSTRYPLCSPPQQRFKASTSPPVHFPTNVVSTHSVNVIEYKKASAPAVCISTLKYPPTPEAQRSYAGQQAADNGEDQSFIVANIAGRMTFHSQLSVESVGSGKTDGQDREETVTTSKPSLMSSPQVRGHMSPPLQQKYQGRGPYDNSSYRSPGSAMAQAEYGTTEPVYTRIQKNHSEKVEAPVVAKRPVYHTTRSIDEGTTVFSTQQSDTDRGMLIRSKTLPAAASRTGDCYEHVGSQQARALSPGITVQWNARRSKEAAEGSSRFQDASRFDERARACEAERGARAKLVPSSRSLSDATGSSSTSSPIGKNLGQRIRDVIQESSQPYKEVFTAELSPTCSSDDPDHIPNIDDDWDDPRYDFPPRRSPYRRGQYSGSSVDSYEDTRYSSDSPSFPGSPPSKRAAKVCGRSAAVKKTDVNRRTGDSDRETSVSNVVIQENVSYLPESITIRRIDVHANVILPCQAQQQQQHKGQTIITPAFPAVGANIASPWYSARTPPATGFVPEVMESSVDPEDAHTGASDDGSKLAETVRTQPAQRQAKTGLGTQTKPQLLPAEKPQHQETAQAETAATAAAKQQKGKEQNALAAEMNATSQAKGDNQASVFESGTDPSSSLATPSASQSPHPAPASAPTRTARAATNTDRQQRKTGKECENDSSFSQETTSTPAAVCGESTPECQPNATHSKPSGGAKTSTPEIIPGRESKTAALTSHRHGNRGDGNVSEDVITPAKQKEISQQLDNNGITETYDNGSPKPNADEDGGEAVLAEHVPPPSPTAMDLLLEEEEEEEDEDMFNAHKDSDISFMISKEMQQFGETVVKRLSSLLESQASESDSCLEDCHGRSARNRNGTGSPSLKENPGGHTSNVPTDSQQNNNKGAEDQSPAQNGWHRPGGKLPVGRPSLKIADDGLEDEIHPPKRTDVCDHDVPQQESATLPDVAKPKLTPSFPSAESFLTESDTTENFSADQETTTSSNRASTASTATDETLTSFKTRSTTDSAEFDDAHFLLPESLVFVRSVDEDDAHKVDDAVIESGHIVRRPSIPKELTRSGGASREQSPQKPRKKRRRQPASSYDNVTKADVNEPEPKRGSKQIRDVIDAYCDESEDSDFSNSSGGACFKEVVRRSEAGSVGCEPLHKREDYLGQVRKPKPPADRSSSGSSDDSDVGARKRLSSSSRESSLRIPEIEETFSELMNVKTFLDDLQDRTPTAETVPVFVGSDDTRTKEYWSAGVMRRSRMSPAKTDRTESDLDASEQRDDASTDSMYADDEDEGTEVVFQRSYSEEHGGEVLLSCTIYNSTHDDGADSDDFWAESSAAEENYKKLETAADEAGSAFQNARLQMHDIHQHLQDLRRQMELLQDDITSTSLTLTPDYSLESCEPRPVTE